MSAPWSLSRDAGPIFKPRSGLASVILDDLLYLFGAGQSNVWRVKTSDIIANTENHGQLLDTTKSAKQPHWIYTPAGLLWQPSPSHALQFLVVGQAEYSDVFLSMQLFDTESNTWLPFPPSATNMTDRTSSSSSNSDIPLASRHHSAFLLNNNEQLIIYGGENTTHVVGHFWSFQVSTRQWFPLPLPSDIYVMRCGHSGNLLNDQRLLIIGGFTCKYGELLNSNGSSRPLVNMSKVLLYDTVGSQWSEQLTLGPYPEPRAYHTSVKSTDSVIVIGGQNGTPPPYQTYISSDRKFRDMVAVLNTTTWQWTIVNGTPSIDQPLPQSMALGHMINNHTVWYGFGTNYQTVHNTMYLFDTLINNWMPSNGEQTDISGSYIKWPTNVPKTRYELHIILACISALCLVTVAVFLYRMGYQWRQKSIAFLCTCKKKIWKPRIGEPSWTETIRLTLVSVYSCFFLFLIFCLAEQVVNSPIIDQVSYVENPTSTVDVPDIRFCLDDQHSVIRCGTDQGIQCSDYIIPLNTTLAHYHRQQYCYLFRAPSTFRLGQTSDRLASHGSYLKFDYYFGQPSHVEVAFYNAHHDPNLPVYSISDSYSIAASPFTWNDPLEELTFRVTDSKGFLVNNVYHLNANVVSSGSYELLERVSLRDTFWNYVGFFPQVEKLYGIDTKVQSETTTTDYSSAPRPLGSFHVYPLRYEIKTLHEQRAFAIVNATGVFGGLFGLLVSFQVSLFGMRPKSPLGLVHRWSIGQMKRSLLHGLQKSFVPQSTNVPIVHPMRDQTLNSTLNASSTLYTTKSRIMTAAPPLDESVATIEGPSTMTSTRMPSPAVIRQGLVSTPSPLLDNGFVEEPESYDDDTDLLFKSERLTRIEDRIEVLEKVFQAYYIDDEIFRVLEMALHIDPTQLQFTRPYHLRCPTLSSLRSRIPFRRRS